MPKAILEFNIPEEAQEHKDAVEGTDWKLVVWDIDQLLRNYLKHGCSNSVCADNRDAAFEHVRDEIYKIVEEKNLNLFN